MAVACSKYWKLDTGVKSSGERRCDQGSLKPLCDPRKMYTAPSPSHGAPTTISEESKLRLHWSFITDLTSHNMKRNLTVKREPGKRGELEGRLH
ncbi:hypothetical protein E2C01_025965 [Portunus trituberculatus]|uniref:Uncharacterized protein n=1 Tax=Portunus trituberculatus TaxID=210409 RepID=A0A5B7EHX3_PORTR|nr:hypothetical protein [Portunus trituberculatus]